MEIKQDKISEAKRLLHTSKPMPPFKMIDMMEIEQHSFSSNMYNSDVKQQLMTMAGIYKELEKSMINEFFTIKGIKGKKVKA